MTAVTLARGIISRPESLTSTSTRSPSLASPADRRAGCAFPSACGRSAPAGRHPRPCGRCRSGRGAACRGSSSPGRCSAARRRRRHRCGRGCGRRGRGRRGHLGRCTTLTRGCSPSSSFHCAGKAWRSSGSASVGMSSTVTAGRAAVRRIALRVRAMKPSPSISLSSTLKGVRMSPDAEDLGEVALAVDVGLLAIASSNCSRVGSSPPVRGGGAGPDDWRGLARLRALDRRFFDWHMQSDRVCRFCEIRQ